VTDSKMNSADSIQYFGKTDDERIVSIIYKLSSYYKKISQSGVL